MGWIERWEAMNIPWDAGASPPVLGQLLADGHLPPSPADAPLRALVPGAGSGYDVLTLAAAGWQAVGIDLAPGAGRRFAELRQAAELTEARARLLVGDAFTADVGGPVDLWWDYTFLCALQPEMRPTWAARAAELVRPGGLLATLVFPIVDRDPTDGPPFPLTEQLVAELVQGPFEAAGRVVPAASHPGREGKEIARLWRRVA